MIVRSLNVKGLIDPLKALAVKQWLLQSQEEADVLCFQEIKAQEPILMQRLRTVDPKRFWISMNHPVGTGGSAIGITERRKDIVQILTDPCNMY